MQLGSWEDNDPSVIHWDTDLGRERQSGCQYTHSGCKHQGPLSSHPWLFPSTVPPHITLDIGYGWPVFSWDAMNGQTESWKSLKGVAWKPFMKRPVLKQWVRQWFPEWYLVWLHKSLEGGWDLEIILELPLPKVGIFLSLCILVHLCCGTMVVLSYYLYYF